MLRAVALVFALVAPANAANVLAPQDAALLQPSPSPEAAAPCTACGACEQNVLGVKAFLLSNPEVPKHKMTVFKTTVIADLFVNCSTVFDAAACETAEAAMLGASYEQASLVMSASPDKICYKVSGGTCPLKETDLLAQDDDFLNWKEWKVKKESAQVRMLAAEGKGAC